MDPATYRLLGRLAQARVDFVVAGGVAVVLHGHERSTKNLDIVVAPELENLRRLGSVMTAVNGRLSGVDDVLPFVADERILRHTETLALATDEGRLDLLIRPSGSASYDELRARAVLVDVDGVPTPVVSLDDLIAMKRVDGRPRDVADLVQLEAIRRLRARPPDA